LKEKVEMGLDVVQRKTEGLGMEIHQSGPEAEPGDGLRQSCRN